MSTRRLHRDDLRAIMAALIYSTQQIRDYEMALRTADALLAFMDTHRGPKQLVTP